jgi:hypothetical protein
MARISEAPGDLYRTWLSSTSSGRASHGIGLGGPTNILSRKNIANTDVKRRGDSTRWRAFSAKLCSGYAPAAAGWT